ncbi:MAG: DUF4249 family protein, partial [Mariniphaga sp.]|nr:DUF4249 family protein [Mariniphaga sp.]
EKQITDAKVLWYVNGVLSDTLIFNDDFNGYTTNYFYFPTEGNTYSVKIVKGGFRNVSATNYVPSEVKIKNLEVTELAGIDEEKSAYTSISLTFKDPIATQNFYEIIVSPVGEDKQKFRLWSSDKIITAEVYYPSPLAVEAKNPRRLLFNDKHFNGKEKNIILYYEPPQFENIHRRWIGFHIIDIHLRSVTEEYYNYYTSMLQHKNNQESDILYGLGEPVNVYSNIEGGYGVFAGYYGDAKTCIVDTLTVYYK